VEKIGDIESWIALGVWTVALIAMLRYLVVAVGLGSRIPRLRGTARRYN
jgi:hypothetical protein